VKYPVPLPTFPPPTRAALVDSIAADRISAERARQRGDDAQASTYETLARMGQSALRRFDALHAEPASGVRRNPTLVGVAPAPTTQRQVSSSTRYSFVATGRRR
jgi:hypothetical protein